MRGCVLLAPAAPLPVGEQLNAGDHVVHADRHLRDVYATVCLRSPRRAAQSFRLSSPRKHLPGSSPLRLQGAREEGARRRRHRAQASGRVPESSGMMPLASMTPFAAPRPPAAARQQRALGGAPTAGPSRILARARPVRVVLREPRRLSVVAQGERRVCLSPCARGSCSCRSHFFACFPPQLGALARSRPRPTGPPSRCGSWRRCLGDCETVLVGPRATTTHWSSRRFRTI